MPSSWSSQNYLNENNTIDRAAGMDVYKHKKVVEFTFRTRKDWREVTKMEVISDDIVATVHVEYL